MQSRLVFLCFSLLFFSISAQDSLILSQKEFLAIVKKHHPLAYKYRLQYNIAKAEILRAKGAFDPLLSAKAGEKNLDGTQYYKEQSIDLEIPTWYGIALQGGYQNLQGERLNNRDTKGGLTNFGVTVPLAKNLLYDARRAVLDQARFALKMTEAEQNVLVNDLFLDAENTYWDWAKNYELYKISKKSVEINLQRLELTKRTYELGERPAIDTVEAAAQLLSFRVQEREAYLDFVRSTQNLQLFLWNENQEIFPYTENLVPAVDITEICNNTDEIFLAEQVRTRNLQSNAALLYYFQKGNILESERRLKWQSFLPKLDFTYNFLSKENYRADLFPFFNNNFQYGLKLEVPVFLRQARADYQIAKLKIEQNRQDFSIKERELQTKIETYIREINTYQTQIELSESNIINYQKLLTAEEMRYANGESSLFLINSRENKLYEARVKNLELRTKFLQTYNKLKWLNENFIIP